MNPFSLLTIVFVKTTKYLDVFWFSPAISELESKYYARKLSGDCRDSFLVGDESGALSSLRSAPVSVGSPLQKSGKDSALPEHPSRFCQMEWPLRQKTDGFGPSPDCRGRVRELLLGSIVRTSPLSLADFHPLLLHRSSCVEARPGTVQTGLDEESSF